MNQFSSVDEIPREMRRAAQVIRDAGQPDIAEGNEYIADAVDDLLRRVVIAEGHLETTIPSTVGHCSRRNFLQRLRGLVAIESAAKKLVDQIDEEPIRSDVTDLLADLRTALDEGKRIT